MPTVDLIAGTNKLHFQHFHGSLYVHRFYSRTILIMRQFIVSIILAGAEFIFTIMKALLLGSSNSFLQISGVISFLVESALGLALAIRLLLNTLEDGVSNKTVFATAIVILSTEAVTVLTGIYTTYQKLSSNNKADDSAPNSRMTAEKLKKRQVLKWFAVLLPIALIVFAFTQPSGYDGDQRVGVIVLYALVVVEVLVLSIIWILLSRQVVLRIWLSVIVLIVDIAVGAGLLIWGGLITDDAKDNYNFKTVVSVSIFFLAVGSAITSLSSFGLLSFKKTGKVTYDQVYFVETVVVVMIAPIIVISTTERARTSAIVTALTILPQIGALLVPILLDYVF